jgi:hypothetical protein
LEPGTAERRKIFNQHANRPVKFVWIPNHIADIRSKRPH